LDEQLPETLQKNQVFAIDARYEDGPFDLPASREILLADLLGLLAALEERIHDQS
jgi:hypothetical protein